MWTSNERSYVHALILGTLAYGVQYFRSTVDLKVEAAYLWQHRVQGHVLLQRRS